MSEIEMKDRKDKNFKKEMEVCVIGGGFSGMTSARILNQNGISCEIFSDGFSASNLWPGTVDILNYPGDNLDLELAKFQTSLKDHPYNKLSLDDIKNSMQNFFQTYKNIHSFGENRKLVNKPILTMLGKTKLTVGVWNTIFRDYEKLTPETNIVIIQFKEYINSSMNLIAKGFEEYFPGHYYVIEVSLNQLFGEMNSKLKNNLDEGTLTAKDLALFFDEKSIHMAPLANIIKSEIKKQIPNINEENISFYFFPPILGIELTLTIKSQLENFLGSEVHEILAFAPSANGYRLKRKMEYKLQLLSVPINKNFVLTSIEKDSENIGKKWRCIFKDNQRNLRTIHTKYVIIATGSLFVKDILADKMQTANLFHKLNLDFPESIGKNFEVMSSEKHSNIFITGSAAFHFSTNLNADDEINDGIGIGLSISSSYKVAHTIIRQIKLE